MHTLASLGYASNQIQQLKDAIDASCGAILISGLSDYAYKLTVSALLEESKLHTNEIAFAENMVGMSQEEVARRMQTIFNHNPAMIVIGVMTKMMAPKIIQATESGIKVIAKIHCGSVDQISSTLNSESYGLTEAQIERSGNFCLFVHQEITPLLCQRCAQTSAQIKNKSVLEMLAQVSDIKKIEKLRWRKPRGCSECEGTGHKGRTIIAETLIPESWYAPGTGREKPPNEDAIAAQMSNSPTDMTIQTKKQHAQLKVLKGLIHPVVVDDSLDWINTIDVV